MRPRRRRPDQATRGKGYHGNSQIRTSSGARWTPPRALVARNCCGMRYETMTCCATHPGTRSSESVAGGLVGAGGHHGARGGAGLVVAVEDVDDGAADHARHRGGMRAQRQGEIADVTIILHELKLLDEERRRL